MAGALDRAVMAEKILAAVIRGDESETLGIVEPLHGTCSHVYVLKNCCERLSEPPSGTMLKGRNRLPLEAAFGGKKGLRFTVCDPAGKTLPQKLATAIFAPGVGQGN